MHRSFVEDPKSVRNIKDSNCANLEAKAKTRRRVIYKVTKWGFVGISKMSLSKGSKVRESLRSKGIVGSKYNVL